MPRTLIARPRGGASGRVRRRYAARQKLLVLEECNRLQRVENLSLRRAAASMNVNHSQVLRWYHDREKIADSLGRRKAITEGPVGQLNIIKDDLPTSSSGSSLVVSRELPSPFPTSCTRRHRYFALYRKRTMVVPLLTSRSTRACPPFRGSLPSTILSIVPRQTRPSSHPGR